MRSALAARGIRKQMALAAELGVDESAISRWQRNSGVSLKHAARLCEALDISLDWLVLGRGEMNLHHRSHVSDPPGRTIGSTALLPAPIVEVIVKLTLVISEEFDAQSSNF